MYIYGTMHIIGGLLPKGEENLFRECKSTEKQVFWQRDGKYALYLYISHSKNVLAVDIKYNRYACLLLYGSV